MSFFDVGDILTLGITLLLVILFRYLDRNNRSLEKVKKFTEKAKSDFDEHVHNRSQSLQDASVDLSVQQTQALAAVKRLDEMRGNFDTDAERLDDFTQRMAV
ncbi:MAG: hypothetical protein LBR47_06450, partial [Spirochaetaceae bacterium]|nr:hypothetical protein [Spirochaetaceae bacterium]